MDVGPACMQSSHTHRVNHRTLSDELGVNDQLNDVFLDLAYLLDDTAPLPRLLSSSLDPMHDPCQTPSTLRDEEVQRGGDKISIVQKKNLIHDFSAALEAAVHPPRPFCANPVHAPCEPPSTLSDEVQRDSRQTCDECNTASEECNLLDTSPACADATVSSFGAPGLLQSVRPMQRYKQVKKRKRTQVKRLEVQDWNTNEGGFIDVPRQLHRRLEDDRAVLVDGNERTCMQDALFHGLKALNFTITRKELYKATLPATGDTKINTISNYSKEEWGVNFVNARDASFSKKPFFQLKFGAEHNLLQFSEGVYFVMLTVSQYGKPDDKHAVIYDANFKVKLGGDDANYAPFYAAGYTHDTLNHIHGVIIDNESNTAVKYLEPSDRELREGVSAARAAFNSLFPFASKVSLTDAWAMHK